jgi:hypothetical protein
MNMGRYDALTQLEEKPEKKTPPVVVSSPTSKHPQAQPPKSDGAKKPANPQDRKPANLSTSLGSLEKPEKYTTRLEPSLVKKIRLDAVEKDMNDYDVVKTALTQYFERNK